MKNKTLLKLSDILYHVISERKHFLYIIGSALIIRLIWMLVFNVRQTSDFEWYFERAVSIAAGTGYVQNGLPTAQWPIGYPAFLGLIFFLTNNSVALAKIIHIALYIWFMFVFYRIAFRITGSEKTSRLTILLIALYPNHIAYSSIFASEIPFLFFLSLSLYFLLVRNPSNFFNIILSGVFFGLAIIIKPIALFLPLILLLFFSFKQNKAALFISLYVPIILIMLPWTMRNYNVYHEFLFSSSNVGVNLLIGNNPYATGTYNYKKEVSSLIGSPEDTFIEGKRSQQYALNYILQHPVRTVMLVPAKFLHLFLLDIDGTFVNYNGLAKEDSVKRAFLIVYGACSQLYYLLVLLLFIRGLALAGREIFGQYKLIFVVGVYFVVMYMPFFGASRFHFPIIPFFMILSSISILDFVEKKNDANKLADTRDP